MFPVHRLKSELLMHAKQALCNWSHIPSSENHLKSHYINPIFQYFFKDAILDKPLGICQSKPQKKPGRNERIQSVECLKEGSPSRGPCSSAMCSLRGYLSSHTQDPLPARTSHLFRLSLLIADFKTSTWTAMFSLQQSWKDSGMS